METDDISVRYADEAVGIVLWLMADEDGEARTVLAEGRPSALRLLGELMIAVADGKSGDSFHIFPFGPGNKHFDIKSEPGIYIQGFNRLSCLWRCEKIMN
jgi:hypothetical protein